MNRDRLEAICNLILETATGLSKPDLETMKPDICRNVLKLSKLADSIGRRYKQFGDAAGYQDQTKYLGHKARTLGRHIGLVVDTSRYPLPCTIGERTVYLP
jgi:hypothetical protein